MYLKRLFQKTHLRFRGEHKLVVKRATPPSDILWENLETRKSEQRRRRFITFFGTLFVLAISFGVLFMAGAAGSMNLSFA